MKEFDADDHLKECQYRGRRTESNIIKCAAKDPASVNDNVFSTNAAAQQVR